MVPPKATHKRAVSASPDLNRLIADVAAGRRSVDRAWHLFRSAGADLDQWIAFATVCRGHGRHYDNVWARHQWLCWTVESDEGTYPEQRAKWLRIQQEFTEQMRAKRGGITSAPIRTNAELRAASCKAEPDHAQLALFS